ncbi:MAG: hypothetical protein ABI330_12495 [Caldimonas sp.]|nr:hypothetical protein [Pseudomonadota bacterium]
MKTKLALSAIVAAVAVFSQGAFAQASSPTRAEVKAQARTGSLAPAGEGPGAMVAAPPKTSDTTRAARKSSTRMARKAGTLKPAGDAGDMKTDDATRAKMTTTNRADRKAQTKAEVKAGTTQKPGDTAAAVGDAPKK